MDIDRDLVLVLVLVNKQAKVSMLNSTFGFAVYKQSQFVLKDLDLYSFTCCLVYVFIHT